MLKLSSTRHYAILIVTMPTLLLALVAHAQTGTITGRVFCSDTQTPARFAAVLLSKSGSREYTQTDGTFVLKDVPAGNQQLEVIYPGYIRIGNWDRIKQYADPDSVRYLDTVASGAQVTVLPGRTTSAMITIYRGAELGGTVNYDDGSPAAGLDVTVTYVIAPSNDPSSGTRAKLSLGPDVSASTDSRGRFQITGLMDGSYIVSVRSGERFAPFSTYFGNTVEVSKAALVKIGQGEARSDLQLQIGLSELHSVRGVLTGADHLPIANASVQLTFAEDVNNEEVRLTTTLEDGSFVFPSVPDGNFVLQGGKSKVYISPTTVIVSGRDVNDVTLTAKPSH